MPNISWQPSLKGLARWTMLLGVVGLLAGLALIAPGAAQSDKSDKAGTLDKAGKDDKAPKDSKDKNGKAKGKSTKQEDAKAKQKAEEEALADPFAAEHPQIILTGLRCQIHRDGKVQQEVQASTGQFDELANILDLNRLSVKYLDQGTTTAVGQLNCGRGRVWTTSHPDKGISAHDMLLQGGVRMQTKDQMVLQSPEMRYNAQASTLGSDKTYIQQMPAGKQFMIGKGQRFELKLSLADTSTTAKNSFEYWKAFGSPAEMRKSEKPVLNP